MNKIFKISSYFTYNIYFGRIIDQQYRRQARAAGAAVAERHFSGNVVGRLGCRECDTYHGIASVYQSIAV